MPARKSTRKGNDRTVVPPKKKLYKFEVLHRFTDNVMFVAEIDCAENTPDSIKRGLAVRWAWAKCFTLANASLVGADLQGADLQGADLSYADLRRANFTGADLGRASLYGANLDGANFTGADLIGADFSRASLLHSIFSSVAGNAIKTHFASVDFAHAHISYTNFCGADLGSANLIDGGLRSDGYRFFAVRKNDRVMIKAGCRLLSLAEAREWWGRTRGGTRLGNESLALVDHLERLARIAGWLKATPIPEIMPERVFTHGSTTLRRYLKNHPNVTLLVEHNGARTRRTYVDGVAVAQTPDT